MAYAKELIKELEKKAKTLRRDTIEMMKESDSGWMGGSFSQADIIAVLVFHHMNHDPQNPLWEDRDRLIVSKAHCCETVYAALGEAGYFSKSEYQTYGKFGATLQAHTDGERGESGRFELLVVLRDGIAHGQGGMKGIVALPRCLAQRLALKGQVGIEIGDRGRVRRQVDLGNDHHVVVTGHVLETAEVG